MASETNPYAIRAGLLELAKNIISENAHMAFEAARKQDGDGIPGKNWSPYTTEQVVLEAEKLYAFVSRK